MKISYDIRRYFDRIFFIYPVKLGEIYPPICPVKLGEIWTPKNGQITWDWTSQIQELMSLTWLDVARPIVFIGQTGMGKSYLAEAIGRYACSKRKTVLFKESTELFLMISEARRLNRYLSTRKRLASFDILIIDDFGMRKLNSTEAQDLKELLELRSISKSTFFTTQLPLKHWGEVIEDVVILEAIVDLVDHSSIKIEMKGEKTYREIKAKKLDSKSKNE